MVALSASAQSTTGEIRGRVENAAGGEGLGTVVIIARSPSAIGEQFGFSEPDGRFVIPLLPPGTYELSLEIDGFRPRTVRGVTVELGRARNVAVEMVPTALEAEEIVVTAPEAPAINRGSFETGTNINREFYRNVPSGRRYTEILRDTPGSSQDDVGTSVFGSTGVENTYIVEGLNTTDIGFGRAGADLNVDFFEELEIKSAGYMPEFGRSTGGIFNLVLRSGGNEYHGDVFFNATPGFLRADPTPIYRAGEAIGRQDDQILEMDAGFAVGGPIIEDRLWFFAGFNPTMNITDVNRIFQSRVDDDGDGVPDTDDNGNDVVREVGRDQLDRNQIFWQFAGKLTLALTPDHTVALSYFGNPWSANGVIRGLGDSPSTNGINGDESYISGDRYGGSHNIILNYMGQILDRRMRVEAFAGVHTARDVLENQAQPVENFLYERPLSDFQPGVCAEDPSTPFVDCPVNDYRAGGTGFYYDESLTRYTGGLRLTNLIQNHTVRYGAEVEYKTYQSTRGYSGGFFERVYGPSAIDDPYANERYYFARLDDAGETLLLDNDGVPAFSADVATLTVSAYLQDSWELNEYLTIGGGLRWDFEQMLDTAGAPAITIPDEFAPRLGASFDPTGVGRSRIYASYGWFYESVPLDINQRSFSAEGIGIRYADDDGNTICWDEEGNPVPGGAPPDCTYDPYGVLGGSSSPVVNDLKGQYHDEWVLGAEYELIPGWVVGIAAVTRQLQRAIEDISPDDGNNYFIANPGENDCNVPEEYRDPLRDYCTGEDGEYDENATLFPNASRLYQGITFTTRKRLSDHVQFLASYTLSELKGNYPGLYSPDNGQLDPNISSQFDLLDLTVNRYGLLPNNHTHNIKLAGSYEFGGVTETLTGFTVGVRYEALSGAPINYLARHPYYGRQEAFILPRGAGGETPWLHRFDLYLGYDIPIADEVVLNFNATVFNVFNFQEVTAVNQEYTTDVVTPQPAGTNLADITNEDGDPVNVNPTFGQALARQAPMSVRLGVRLTF
jgi:hypothetical protein